MKLTFAKYDFRIKKEGEQSFIFDMVRKRFVALTPEEWVRQHWLHYLIEERKYPRSLIAVEMQMQLNQLSKRCDIVVFNKKGQPELIVECKATGVKIAQHIFDQIARYNLTLRVKYLVVTNGNEHHCCEIDFENNSYHFLESLPELH